MFCTVCGAQLEENGAFCTHCGSPVQSVETPVCEIPPVYEAPTTYNAVPPYVSPATVDANADSNISPKSRTAALILAITLGSMGINRLYLGTSGGVSRLIMLILGYVFYIIGCFVWPFLLVALPLLIIPTVGGIKDIIRSAKGTMVDKDGLPVKKW